MACFLAPMAAVIFTTLFRKKMPENMHIEWFNVMGWGAVIALAVEHLISGEVVPWFPFLTAMGSAEATGEMLVEIATIGGAMLGVITIIWVSMVLFVNHFSASTGTPATEGA